MNVVVPLLMLFLAVVSGMRLGPPETVASLPPVLNVGPDAGLFLLVAVVYLVVVPVWAAGSAGQFAASVLVKLVLVGALSLVTVAAAAPDVPGWTPAQDAVPYPDDSEPGKVQEAVADFLAIPPAHLTLSATATDFRARFAERNQELLTARLNSYPVAGDPVVQQALNKLVATGGVAREATGS